MIKLYADEDFNYLAVKILREMLTEAVGANESVRSDLT